MLFFRLFVLVRQLADAECMILIEYYSELLSHVSKNWEVRTPDTTKIVKRKGQVIGIFSSCMDYPIFRYVIYVVTLNNTLSISHRNAEKMESLLVTEYVPELWRSVLRSPESGPVRFSISRAQVHRYLSKILAWIQIKNSNSTKTERQFNTRQIQKKHKMVQQLKMSWQITICLHLKKFRVWFTGHATRAKTSGDVQPLLPHFSFTVPLQHSCCLCL